MPCLFTIILVILPSDETLFAISVSIFVRKLNYEFIPPAVRLVWLFHRHIFKIIIITIDHLK